LPSVSFEAVLNHQAETVVASISKKSATGRGAVWKWSVAGAAGATLASLAFYGAQRRGARLPDRNDRRRPSWGKLLAEGPAAARLVAAQFAPVSVRNPELGRGRAVLVIPGLVTNDMPTLLLRRTLKACGFKPFGWSQGINRGVRADLFERLGERLDEILQEAGGPVAVVGWSLGGLYARELAKRRTADISLVVTAGSPFSVDLRDNNAWKLYEGINDHPVDAPPVPVNVEEKPPVHTVAIWSPLDGIVAPASASGKPWEADERIEVDCPHNELVSHPDAVRTLVDLLATRPR
jgi:hypothetical protein